MKRLISMLILVILTLCLTSCAGKESANQTTQQTEAEPQFAGLANPMQEYPSLEALSKEINAAIIKPQDAEIADEKFFIINGEPRLAEYRFTVDGKQCTLRTANVGVDTDISGIYVENGTIFQDNPTETCYYETDDFKAERWFTMDGQYVFTVDDDSDWEWKQFDALCSQFMDMEPKNWDSDVPFADYLALTGYYGDGKDSIASVDIKGNHVYVIVRYTVDGVTYDMEVNAKLDGGKLVYEKESRYEEPNNEKIQIVNDGPGYIEIQDGSLVLSGVNTEPLKGLVLAPLDLSTLSE